MRKTDKKRENQIRAVLTDVCEAALKDIEGFCWLTHLVNYDNFPQSIQVICVFDTDEQLKTYLNSDRNDKLLSLIRTELTKLNITLKHLSKHLHYDTEEQCKQQHNGNWAKRLESTPTLA